MLVYLLVLLLYYTFSVFQGGMYLLQLFDWYAASISVILICFVEVFIIGWAYGIDNFIRDLEFMIQKKIHWWWLVSWKFITPTILAVIYCNII